MNNRIKGYLRAIEDGKVKEYHELRDKYKKSQRRL